MRAVHVNDHPLSCRSRERVRISTGALKINSSDPGGRDQPLASGPARVIVILTMTRRSRRMASR